LPNTKRALCVRLGLVSPKSQRNLATETQGLSTMLHVDAEPASIAKPGKATRIVRTRRVAHLQHDLAVDALRTSQQLAFRMKRAPLVGFGCNGHRIRESH
jgi:hypothetical protein